LETQYNNKMDKLKAIFESYQSSGLLSKQTTFEQFSSADDSVKEYLYNQGVDNKIISSLTDLELFKSAWGLKKKEDSEVTSQGEGTVLLTPQQLEERISVESSPEVETLSEEESSDISNFINNKQSESITDEVTDVDEENISKKVIPTAESGPTVKLTPTTRTTPSEAFFNKSEDPIFQKQEAERKAMDIEEKEAFKKLESDIDEIKILPITEEEIQAEQSRIDSIKTTVPEGYEDQVELEFLQQKSEDPFERGMANAKNFFWQTEAKAAADLNKAFDQYGFKFEEASGLQPAIKVTASNGEEIIISQQRGRERGSNILKEFLNKNRVESTIIYDRIQNAVGNDIKKERRLLTEEELEEENNKYTMKFSEYQENSKEYEERLKKLKNFVPKTPQDLEVYNTEVAKINEMSKTLNQGRDNLIASQGELEKLAGDYVYYEAQKWDVPSLAIQTIAKGFTSIAEGVVVNLVDAVDFADMSWLTGDDDLENDEIYKEVKDRFRRGKDMLLKDLEILGTTQVAIDQIKKDSFVAGALIGTLESAPAMLTGLGGLYFSAYSGADEALRQFKGYEELSDFETVGMKTLLSVSAAVLEKAGLDNAMGKTGMLTQFLSKALGGIPKNASALTVKRTLERKAIDFIKGLGSATAGEGLTGGTQEIADITIKSLYNQAKGINVFKTPKSVGEFVEQVSEATAAEAIGGLVLGGAGAVATAISNEQVLGLPDGAIEMFEMMSASNKFDPLFTKSLKVQLSKGTITKEEAQEQLDNYHEAKSIMKEIPNDYTTPQKKMAFSLLGIKKRLEKEIEGKDPDLVKDRKEQLNSIKEQLTTIQEDVTNMKEGIEISKPNQTYFFDFKSKKEIPDALKSLKPVAEIIIKKSKFSKTENIRIGFKGSQLIESGFAKKSEPKTVSEVQTDPEIVNEAKEESVIEVDSEPIIENTKKAKEDIQEDDLASLMKEVEEKEKEGNFSENIDKKVYKDGKEGMIKIDDTNENTIVFETNEEIIEIGNKDEIGTNLIAEEGFTKMPPEGISVQEKSEKSDIVSVDGLSYNFIGKSKDKRGKAVVKVKRVDNGQIKKFTGPKAERVLKDVALRGEGKKVFIPKIQAEPKTNIEKKSKTEKKIEARKERKRQREKSEEAILKSIEEQQKQSEKELSEFEEEVLKELAEKDKKSDFVSVKGNIYKVTKKDDMTFSVSKMARNGRMIALRDKTERNKAIAQFNRKKTIQEKKDIASAQKLIEEVRKEEEDKILKVLNEGIKKTSSNGRMFDATLGIPMAVANTSLKIIRAAYKAGKSLSEAIQDGLSYIVEKGYSVSDLKYKKYVLKEFYKKSTVEEKAEDKVEKKDEEKAEDKTPPSAKKILGKSKIDKVTVDEMAALKTQIRLESKAAREAKTDVNQKRKDLAEKIKEFEKGKNIPTTKSQAITNKISKVNLDNEAAVEKLLDYISEQYGVEKLKEEVSTSNKKRKVAIKNINSKIGTAKNTFNTFKTLFSYDAKLITDKNLKAKYEEILGRFGSSSSILSVKELDSEVKIAKEIINGIEEEYSTFEDLSDIFYENQVLDEEGNIDYAATMNELSKGDDPILVNDQLDILKKYKSKLELKEVKAPLTLEEKKAVTEGLIKEAMEVKAENKVTDNDTSRKSAENLIKLLKNKKNLEGLSDNQLKSIPKILDNLRNGIFTSRANTIMNALDVKENSDIIAKKLDKSQAMAIESVIRGLQSTITSKTSAYNQIASNPLKDIDTILGLDGTEVYDRSFKRMGSAFAAFQEATREINERLTEVNTKLTKAFRANENQISESKFRMQAYMLQLEYESNPELQEKKGKKGSVFEAVDWIDATINELSGKKQEATIEILRKVREQVKGKSAKEIASKLTKVEKDAIAIVKEINEETAEKALYVGAIVRGSRPNMINEYTHHDVMSTSDLSKKEATDYLKEINNIKTKAGTIESRSPGVKPINLDILNSTMKGAKQTLLDFHVTNENRVIKKTLSEVKKKVSADSQNKRTNKILKASEVSPQEFAVAMEEAYDTAMRIAFGNSYLSTSLIDKMISFGYQAQLASVPRAFAELSSNLGYVALSSPKIFAEGVGLFTEIGLAESIEYMKLSGSSELGKFTGAKNTGKSIDMLAKNADLSKAEGLNALANFIKSVKNKQAVSLTSKAAETVADVLISTPDKAVSMPLWLGAFSRSMKANNVDLARFKSDANYRNEKAKEIEAARNEADQELNRAAGSQNAFAGVLKNKVDKTKDSAGRQAAKYVNGYLTNFLIFEYSTARKGIIQLTKEGKINKLEGLSLLSATTARMASYSIVYKMFSALFFGAFGVEDEQEDELEANDVTRALVGSATSLFLGRNFGTIARKGLNLGTEFLNKEYGQVLRGDEEYDAFEHGLGLAFFNPSEEDMKRKRLVQEITREILGPLSNHVGLLLDMTYSAYNYLNATNDQEKSKAADFLINQAIFETFGLFTGKIPLFKDLKKGLYQIPTNNEFAIKERQISFKDLKSQNPEKYADIDNEFKENTRVKEIDNRLKKLKILVDSGNISEDKLKEAEYEQSNLKKEKEEMKRDFFDKNFGLMDKDKIGKVSESSPENEKTLEQELAEIEVLDEKTYSEYKLSSPSLYKRAENTLKRNRNYSINKKEMKKLNLKLKRARGVYDKENINLKINKLKNENSKIKREVFNKMFKN
jgi:hypothetical protein